MGTGLFWWQLTEGIITKASLCILSIQRYAKDMWQQDGDYAYSTHRENTVLLDREQLTALRDSINKYLEGKQN